MRELAAAYLDIPQYDSAFILTQAVQANFSKYNDSALYIHARKLEGLAHQYTGNYEASIQGFHEVGEYYKRNGDDIFYENQMDIGLVYIRMEAWEKAESYVRACINHPDKVSKQAYGNALNCLGIVKYFADEPDSAIYFYKQSAEVMEANNNLRGATLAYTNIGSVFSEEKGQYDSAGVYLRKGKLLAKQLGATKNLVSLLINEGVNWELQAKYEQAVGNYKEALALAESQEGYLNLRYALFNLADVYGNKLDRPDLAYPYLKRYDALRDSIYQKEKLQAIEEINAKYETAEKDRQLAIAHTKLAREQLYLTIAGAIIGILVLGGLLLWYRNKARQQAALQQARIEEQKRGLNAVIQATEDERRRIARDLHDGVGQELGSLFLGFDQIKKTLPETQVNMLNGLHNQLQQASTHVREISHQMMPRALEIAGLAPALSDLVTNSFSRSDITASFDAIRVPSNLDPEVSLAVYRVGQELVSNIIRHAGATEVDVLLTANASRLSLVVEDNGKGFDHERESGGIGLDNMRARLQTVGGRLEYEAGNPAGTRAMVVVEKA